MNFPKTTKEGRTKGTTKSISCPWCGSANKDLDNMGYDENSAPVIRTGCILVCDMCMNKFELSSVFEVTVVIADRYGELEHRGHLKDGGR